MTAHIKTAKAGSSVGRASVKKQKNSPSAKGLLLKVKGKQKKKIGLFQKYNRHQVSFLGLNISGDPKGSRFATLYESIRGTNRAVTVRLWAMIVFIASFYGSILYQTDEYSKALAFSNVFKTGLYEQIEEPLYGTSGVLTVCMAGGQFVEMAFAPESCRENGVWALKLREVKDGIPVNQYIPICPGLDKTSDACQNTYELLLNDFAEAKAIKIDGQYYISSLKDKSSSELNIVPNAVYRNEIKRAYDATENSKFFSWLEDHFFTSLAYLGVFFLLFESVRMTESVLRRHEFNQVAKSKPKGYRPLNLNPSKDTPEDFLRRSKPEFTENEFGIPHPLRDILLEKEETPSEFAKRLSKIS